MVDQLCDCMPYGDNALKTVKSVWCIHEHVKPVTCPVIVPIRILNLCSKFSIITMFVASLILMLCGEKLGDGTSGPCEGESSQATQPEENKYADFIDKVIHSKVMEELKALPSEIRESLILHVERQSLVVAGVLVAIGAAVLLLGCLWIHWCHTEYVEYIPVAKLEEMEVRLQSKHPQHHRHRHSPANRAKPESERPDGTKVVHRKTRTSHTHIANGGQ